MREDLRGDFIGEVGTKAAARTWLPAAMRFDAVAASAVTGVDAVMPDQSDIVADHEEVPERDAA